MDIRSADNTSLADSLVAAAENIDIFDTAVVAAAAEIVSIFVSHGNYVSNSHRHVPELVNMCIGPVDEYQPLPSLAWHPAISNPNDLYSSFGFDAMTNQSEQLYSPAISSFLSLASADWHHTSSISPLHVVRRFETYL